MKNIDVIKTFVNGGTTGKTKNLRIEGEKLFNYNTCLAQRNGTEIVVNATKYSTSTTTIQNKLLHELTYHMDVMTLANIPMGTQDLIRA
jgi:hypothetical protein